MEALVSDEDGVFAKFEAAVDVDPTTVEEVEDLSDNEGIRETKTDKGGVTAGSEATADSWVPEVEARLTFLFARSRASLCFAKVVLCWLGVLKQSQCSPLCPRSGLTN